MPKRLTQKEYEERVFQAVGNKYSVISEYKGKMKPVTFKCNIHNVEFSANAECFMRGSQDVRSSCPICSEELKNKRFENNRQEVQCAYCGEKFFKQKSKINHSRSGLYFCCREHKDLAQRLNSGDEFNNIRPKHYGISDGKSGYRKRAYEIYEHKCAICNWDEDKDMLEVHHIDENRENNEDDNLIILCSICHRKLTSHKYKLIGREKIVLSNL